MFLFTEQGGKKKFCHSVIEVAREIEIPGVMYGWFFDMCSFCEGSCDDVLV